MFFSISSALSSERIVAAKSSLKMCLRTNIVWCLVECGGGMILKRGLTEYVHLCFAPRTPHHTLPHSISPHVTLPYLTLPYLTLPYLTLPYLTLPYLTLPYLTLPYLTLPYLTLPRLASHRIASHRIASHRITSPHLTLPYLTSPHLTSPHLTSPLLTSLSLTSPSITVYLYFFRISILVLNSLETWFWMSVTSQSKIKTILKPQKVGNGRRNGTLIQIVLLIAMVCCFLHHELVSYTYIVQKGLKQNISMVN